MSKPFYRFYKFFFVNFAVNVGLLAVLVTVRRRGNVKQHSAAFVAVRHGGKFARLRKLRKRIRLCIKFFPSPCSRRNTSYPQVRVRRKQVCARLFEYIEIKRQLQAFTAAYIGKRELIFARFVVYDADKRFSVLFQSVHTVYRARDTGFMPLPQSRS